MSVPNSELRSYYQPEGPERCGFVMDRFGVFEAENVADDPINGFEVSADVVAENIDHITATWHTHPGQSSNLSMGDRETFLNWSTVSHYIVGREGITRYYVEDGELLSEHL